MFGMGKGHVFCGFNMCLSYAKLDQLWVGALSYVLLVGGAHFDQTNSCSVTSVESTSFGTMVPSSFSLGGGVT